MFWVHCRDGLGYHSPSSGAVTDGQTDRGGSDQRARERHRRTDRQRDEKEKGEKEKEKESEIPIKVGIECLAQR